MNSLNVDQRSFNALKESLISQTGLQTIIETFSYCDIYICGGVVRDHFLSAMSPVIKDVDLLVDCSKSELLDKLRTLDNWKKGPFGSPRWFPLNGPYFDIMAIKGFTSGLWTGRNIVDALNQFDISVNALAFNIRTGEFIDPQNGYQDIIAKEIKAIRFDFPDKNLSDEVPLRLNTILWFRYIHYAFKTGFSIEPLTQEWLRKNLYRWADKSVFMKYFFPIEFDISFVKAAINCE